jgi:hypothetical protein
MSFLNGALFSSHPAYNTSLAKSFEGCSTKNDFVDILDTAWRIEPHSFCPEYGMDVIEENMGSKLPEVFKTSSSSSNMMSFDDKNMDPNFFFNFDESNHNDNTHNWVSGVHSIKAFTKLCNLSTPTVMKWLDGQQVYKSSAEKILQALSQSKITKQDLLHMRRMARKRKNEEVVELKQVNSALNTIKFVIGHKVFLNSEGYDGEVQYQVVFEDFSTGFITKADIKTEFENKLLINYWEEHNSKLNDNL